MFPACEIYSFYPEPERLFSMERLQLRNLATWGLMAKVRLDPKSTPACKRVCGYDGGGQPGVIAPPGAYLPF